MGDVHFVRVAIERVEGEATTYLDCDAGTIDVAALDAAVSSRLPGSRATQQGRIVRVELPSADFDPELLDEALDLVASASAPKIAGVYR